MLMRAYMLFLGFPEINQNFTNINRKTFDSNLSGLKNFLYENKVNPMNREDVSCPEEFSWSFHEKICGTLFRVNLRKLLCGIFEYL